MSTTTSTTESRALALLSQGVPSSAVAATLGVTESRISQLLSQEEFATELAQRKFETLQKHNERDQALDTLEDSLIKKLESNLPLMVRPMEIVRSLQVVNNAKRRGVSAPAAIPQQQTFIALTLPIQVVNQFKANAQNQVIEAGDQSLLTMQSGTLFDKLKMKGLTNGSAPVAAEASG